MGKLALIAMQRLNQALVNNEVTEVSNKTILNELQEARETISRLTAHHARSVGWDTRLSAAMKERDDMQQEREGQTHRARLAESRFAALKEKTGLFSENMYPASLVLTSSHSQTADRSAPSTRQLGIKTEFSS